VLFSGVAGISTHGKRQSGMPGPSCSSFVSSQLVQK
jgi:hypothetical protein